MRKLFLPLALVFLLASSLAAMPAAEEEVEDARCHGRLAKIVGTEGDDELQGTPERDVIWGGGGDDSITGSLGNDLLCGGPGADLVHGGRGNDDVDGGAGADDRVIGDLGDDKVIGGPGGGDEVAGSLGIDTVSGGPGDLDFVHGDYGYDRMDGGPGKDDIASFATDVAAGQSGGVKVSLAKHRARGDGHDRLYRFEDLEGSAFDDILVGNRQGNVIDGGAGEDTIRGGGGKDTLLGGQGTDRCNGAKGRTVSCGREAKLKASAYVEIDPVSGGGGGLQLVGGGGRDQFVVAFDEALSTFGITAQKAITVGPGCASVSATQVTCPTEGPARWLMADLGPGPDSLRVEGSVAGAQNIRIAGGLGNDTIHGGDEDDLIEGGFGADRIYGGAGADGLIGSRPGPTFLYGEEDGDLLAAGGGCAGGALVGGPGRDDASFAETPAHPGILHVSFPAHAAWIDAIPGCDRVHLSPTNEDMEGSFDWDILVGDARPNAMLGQPGADRFYGGGGDDVIDARDGTRDFSIQCGRGTAARPGRPVRGTSSGRALTDPFDPGTSLCAITKHGKPVDGLGIADEP
ncbi:MAG TPA: calcium-binding protein [Solirubrobacterales bacterium]|nr:calcium-binding protein [Solirubrobacterales bacterium]